MQIIYFCSIFYITYTDIHMYILIPQDDSWHVTQHYFLASSFEQFQWFSIFCHVKVWRRFILNINFDLFVAFSKLVKKNRLVNKYCKHSHA